MSKDKNISCLIVDTNIQNTRIIENSLETLQGIVGGYIEIYDIGYIFPSLKGIVIVLNECGKLTNLPLSCAFRTIVNTNEYTEYFSGPVIFCRSDDNGNFTSLLEQDISLISSFMYGIYTNDNENYYAKKFSDIQGD